MVANSLDSFIVPDKHRHKTAMDYVVESLRQGILSGAIAEGTALRQEELASKFGLSRMPVRDAIRQLEAEGLVTYEVHKGASVAIMTIEDIVEIYDMRIMAECTALDFGFANIVENDLAQMYDLVSTMEHATYPHQLSELNENFHHLLYSKANRPRLLALIKSLHDSVDRHLRFLLTNLDYHKKSQQDHKRIVNACAQGDREAAKQYLAEHLAEGRDSIVTFLETRRRQDVP